MRTELVIFDCDGVLIDSEVISAQKLIDALAGFGVTIDRAFVAKHFLGRSYPIVLSEVHERFGITLPPRFEQDYRQSLLDAFERDLKIMPGVRQVLADLGTRACVATSSSPVRVKRSLEIVGLTERFGADVFTASSVTRGKPAPDLFFHVAQQMNTAPENCLVIEDSLNGIQAAKAAGMRVWRFTGGSHFTGLDLSEPDEARPEIRFSDFAEFFAFDPGLKAT